MMATAWEPVEVLEEQDEAVEETQVPRLLASLVCDDVAVSERDSRVTLQRVGQDIYADDFPAKLERLAIVNVWSGGLGTFTVAARVRAPANGEEDLGPAIAYGDATMEFHPLKVTNIHLLTLGPADLPQRGLYTVEVLLDGYVVHAYNIVAILDKLETDEEEAPTGAIREGL
jgi:hypothetical protein